MKASTVKKYARRLRNNCEGLTLADIVPDALPNEPAIVSDLPVLTLACIGAVHECWRLETALRAFLTEPRY